MKTIEADILLAAVGEALETMAFIAIEPAAEPAPVADALLVTLAFSGSVTGRLILSAPAALGTAIAANLTAANPDSITTGQALDALRELTNITAGLLLRQLCTLDEMPQLAIPFLSAAQLASLPPGDCLAEFSADGHNVALSLRFHE